MRVAYFAHYAGGSDAASAMDADLFAALRGQGHEVRVLAPYDNPNIGRIGGDIAAARLSRFLLAIPGYGRMLRVGLQLGRDPGLRIVSQYHVFHPATLVAFLVARLRGRPLVARAHDPLPGSYRSAAQGVLFRVGFRIYRRILGHPQTWTLVPSPELKALALNRLGLPEDRVLIVPNNVTPMSPPAPEEVSGLRASLGLDRCQVVLQFGSFTNAGSRTLVEALRMLDRPSVKGLVLADLWRGAQFTRQAVASGIADRLVVLGPQPYARLNVFLGLADVCIGILSADPLAVGSMPRSTLEAMAFGKPVVLAQGVPSASLVEHDANGLLIPAEDPAILAAAIARILDEPGSATTIGTRARETVSARFRSDVVARVFATALEGTA